MLQNPTAMRTRKEEHPIPSGRSLSNLLKNPTLVDLLGGVQHVVLGDEEARKRGQKKTRLERAAPPCFGTCVEMLSRDVWRVHRDVAAAADAALAGAAARRGRHGS